MSLQLRSSTLDSVAVAEKEDFTWKGSDEFSDLGDRYRPVHAYSEGSAQKMPNASLSEW